MSNTTQTRENAFAGKIGKYMGLEGVVTKGVLNEAWKLRPNDFYKGLYNMIVEQSIVDPLKYVDDYSQYLRIGTEPFGDTAELINILMGYRDDYSDKLDVNDHFTNTADALFLTQNFEDRFKISFNSAMVQRAFRNEGGLSSYIELLTKRFMQSKQTTWRNRITNMVQQIPIAYEIGDITNPNNQTQAKAREIGYKISSLLTAVEQPTQAFNSAHVPAAVTRNDYILFKSTTFRSFVDNFLYASQFNFASIEYFDEIRGSVTKNNVIMQFTDDNIVGALVSRDYFYRNIMVNIDSDQSWAATLITDRYNHNHGIAGTVPYEVAILLVKDKTKVQPNVSILTDDIVANPPKIAPIQKLSSLFKSVFTYNTTTKAYQLGTINKPTSKDVLLNTFYLLNPLSISESLDITNFDATKKTATIIRSATGKNNSYIIDDLNGAGVNIEWKEPT